MNGYGGRELAKAYRTVRKNTLQIADEIPEDKYGFVPVPGTRSVAELLVHIAYGGQFQEDLHGVKHATTVQGYDFPSLVKQQAAEEAKPRSKAEIIALLRSEGERYAMWLESLTPEFLAETFTDGTGQNPRTRFEGLLAPKEHEMHHRGQLMLIERMLGITPHLTRARQARAAGLGTANVGAATAAH